MTNQQLTRPRLLFFLLTGPMLMAGCSPMQQLKNVGAAGGELASSLTGVSRPGAPGPEIAFLQKRQFSVPPQVAFAAALSILQDAGYRIQSADSTTGLITGIATSSARLGLGLGGLEKSTLTPIASIHVEPGPQGGSRVRLTLVQSASSGTSGASGEQPVQNPESYRRLFGLLESEIMQRKLEVAEPETVISTFPVTIENEAGSTPAVAGSEEDEVSRQVVSSLEARAGDEPQEQAPVAEGPELEQSPDQLSGE